MKIKSGKCKWFNDVKGFGFVIPEDGGDDVFFHQTSIKADGYRTLHEGEPVEFGVSMPENHTNFLLFGHIG